MVLAFLVCTLELNVPFIGHCLFDVKFGQSGLHVGDASRALAHKMTIRLGRQFSRGKLVELSSQSLLSKWFGESGKLVEKMFDHIHSLADEDSTFVCVLVDEVETLTSPRERSASGAECGDALRVTDL